MKLLVRQLCFAFLLLMLSAAIPGRAGAQSDAVTVSLTPGSPGATIPSDFSGLSYEEGDLLPNASGGYYFYSTNQPLLNIFSTLGLKSLRIGGNTADSGTQPANADISALFGFAAAANVKVLYTLRLKTFDATTANTTASYIMDNFSSDVTCLAIGNEPDLFLGSYSTYQSEAQSYITTISGSNPTAKFCGPSVSPGAGSWVGDFATNFASTGQIAHTTFHEYFGGNGGSTSGAAARNTLLAASMLNNYASAAKVFVSTVDGTGLNYRMEETNSFFDGGSPGASNTFAEALWALDYLYWWANEGAEGVNFHTGDTVSGGTAYYSFFTTTTGGYNVDPGAYAPLAFNLGGHGRIVPVTLTNPSGMDLTAYGVLASNNYLWVTIINKTHESGSTTANLTLQLGGNYSQGNMWLMQAPNNDDSQSSGITLGGASISVNGIWSGGSVPVSVSGSTATLSLSAATAAVIQFIPSGTSCTTPTTPGGLTATAVFDYQINLSWTASTSSCPVLYNVFRSTTSGFVPSSSNQIASGLIGDTSYFDTNVVPLTTYYYVVEAVAGAAKSAASNQASATTGAPITTILINAGGPAVSPFAADEDFSDGTAIDHANTINTSEVTNPAPAAVYQTARAAGTTAGPGAPFSYTIPGFAAGTNYVVRLHFCETYFATAGSREFNVSINGTQVLTDFDIFAAAGGENIANIQQFTEPANASGQFVIVFTSVANNALISGIEIEPATSCSAPTAPSGLSATTTSSSQINLSWTASSSSCGVTYNVFQGTTSGFTPGSGNQITSGVSGTTYSVTGLAASTTYYYVVEGSNSAGTSAASNQASATTQAGATGQQLIAIDAGSTTAVSPFVADEDFSGGTTLDHANTINTSEVTNPAPAAVYQTGRVAGTTAGSGPPFSYTIGGFTAGTNYVVRSHFCETFFTTAGSREFNVSINGTQVLTDFDIYATAGGENIANIQQFTEPANASGQFVIVFTSVVNNALISGIEVDSTSGGSCSAAPTAPSGLGATAISSSQINLSWTASTAGTGCSITYDVFRSTTSGFTPSSSNQIASSVTATTYSDTGLAASTTYYYLIEAADSAGTSAVSNQASATTSASSGSCTSICIDSGSTTAVSPFVADEDFSGGATLDHANTINTSDVTNPAPAAVYQTGRVAGTTAGSGPPFSYTIGGFTAGSSHTVRLHFCETYFTGAGDRVFNVSINGTQVLTNFDIFATAGGENIANIQQFTEAANSSGQYVIVFTSVTNNALISGIEVD